MVHLYVRMYIYILFTHWRYLKILFCIAMLNLRRGQYSLIFPGKLKVDIILVTLVDAICTQTYWQLQHRTCTSFGVSYVNPGSLKRPAFFESSGGFFLSGPRSSVSSILLNSPIPFQSHRRFRIHSFWAIGWNHTCLANRERLWIKSRSLLFWLYQNSW